MTRGYIQHACMLNTSPPRCRNHYRTEPDTRGHGGRINSVQDWGQGRSDTAPVKPAAPPSLGLAATPRFAAYITASKYCHHRPHYRTEDILLRRNSGVYLQNRCESRSRTATRPSTAWALIINERQRGLPFPDAVAIPELQHPLREGAQRDTRGRVCSPDQERNEPIHNVGSIL